jgi:Tfp pilus assembly protein PilP
MSSFIGETSAGRAALAVVLLLMAATAIAQTETPAAGQAAPPAGEAQPETAEPVPPVPEGIEITEGTGFRYESRGRRDPFVSLALGIDVLSPDVRPPGLGGMLIQEVSLRGIVKTVDGYIAMIQGTDNKSYFARTGERLYDGNIQSIDDVGVVFRQEINDPVEEGKR